MREESWGRVEIKIEVEVSQFLSYSRLSFLSWYRLGLGGFGVLESESWREEGGRERRREEIEVDIEVSVSWFLSYSQLSCLSWRRLGLGGVGGWVSLAESRVEGWGRV
jgi:hypothetical protein